MINLNFSENLAAIPWQKIKLVIFDLDGTLYNAAEFQRHAFVKAGQLNFSQKNKDILFTYFSLFEKSPGLYDIDLENFLYESVGKQFDVSNIIVKEVIDYWHDMLLPLLPQAKFAYIDEFFQLLAVQSVKKAVYSNAPIRNKLLLLNLAVDSVVTSLDKNINMLKPNKVAISYLMGQFAYKPEECLFIGDQYDLDGQSAIAANISFVILPTHDADNFYLDLIKSYRDQMSL